MDESTPEFEIVAGRARLEVRGEIDVATAPDLARALERVIDDHNGATVTIDLGGVSFIDSSGLGALVEAQKEARRRGGALRCTNLQGSARKVFEITGLLELFGIPETPPRATTESDR
ncbi:MAG: STAS domain-containing protein [Acidimicrobiia bacterium]